MQLNIAYHLMRLKKCLGVLPKNRRDLRTGLLGCVFFINNSPIEFVDSFMHLCHMFTSQFNDGLDIANQRAAFIGQVDNMLCFFRKVCRRMLNLNCSVPIALVFTVVNYGRLTLAASQIFALLR